MKIKYDKNIDAKYVSIKKGKIVSTKKIKEWLLFDCDKTGEVLGVEILEASKNLVAFSTINGKLFCSAIVSIPERENAGQLNMNVIEQKEEQWMDKRLFPNILFTPNV